MRALIRLVALTGLLLVLLLPTGASSTPEAAVVIDFTSHGHGEFDRTFYRKDGVVFTHGSFVGFIQGDDALVGPVAGRFNKPVSSLSAWVAPALQGTAEYTLLALDGKGNLVASRSIVITQDEGDPANGPWGYVEIDLGELPQRAKSFRLSNRFVRSSFPHVTSVQFGVSIIEYTR